VNVTIESRSGPGRTPLEQYFGEDFYRRFFGDAPERMPRRSLGSGVVIDASGVTLTNAHVVAEGGRIHVLTADGTQHGARLLGRDEATDLAVLQIEGAGRFTPAVLGDSDAMQVGDWVIAVGSPFGLRATVTAGIISAKARHIGAGPFDDFLQTDAAINPGNSGGPLVNMRGEVIGINTAIVAGGAGIGFAIPSSLARRVADELRQHGRVTRGWLGVSVQALTPELAQSAGVETGGGVLVAAVQPGSPAARAGLQPGDVIVRFGEHRLQDPADLQRAVGLARPGTQATATVARKGSERRVSVTLGETPRERAAAERAR
jgi:serine protease Do